MALTAYVVEILFEDENWHQGFIVDVVNDAFISANAWCGIVSVFADSIKLSYVRFGSDGESIPVDSRIMAHFKAGIESGLKGFVSYLELTVTGEEE